MTETRLRRQKRAPRRGHELALGDHRAAFMRPNALPRVSRAARDRDSCASETGRAHQTGQRRRRQQSRTVQVHQIARPCGAPCADLPGEPRRRREEAADVGGRFPPGRVRAARDALRRRKPSAAYAFEERSIAGQSDERVPPASRRAGSSSSRSCCAPPGSLNWSSTQQLHTRSGQRQHEEVHRQHAPVREQVAGGHLHDLRRPRSTASTCRRTRAAVGAAAARPARRIATLSQISAASPATPVSTSRLRYMLSATTGAPR